MALCAGEEDVIEHRSALREIMKTQCSRGKRPRARICLSGRPVTAKVIGYGQRGPLLDIEGGRIELAWANLDLTEELSVLREFVPDTNAEGLFSVMVLCRRLGLHFEADQLERRCLTADLRMGPRIAALRKQFAPPPPRKVTRTPRKTRKRSAKRRKSAGKAGAAEAQPKARAEAGLRTVGPRGRVGAPPGAKTMKRLTISSSGVYENLIIDGGFAKKDLVRIKASNVTLRNCTIRNGQRDGIVVYGKKVVIERCEIHHLLAGVYGDGFDAHGITGRPTDLVIRDCEIHHVSGDALQFDPGRGPWDKVLVENCSMWTGPLHNDAAGYKKGQRPGENAVDTKQGTDNARSKMVLRNCVARGWGKGEISNQAAFNIKNHVQVLIEGCVLSENDICLRLRGPGSRGGAWVTVRHCAMYDSKIGVRMEDNIQNLKLLEPAFGDGVRRKYTYAGGRPGRGFEKRDETVAPPIESALSSWGVAAKSAFPPDVFGD